MKRSLDTTDLAEYQRNLRAHHERVNQSGKPLYVTADGEADAVVLSRKAFEELTDRADMGETLAMIDRSEADLQAGRVVEGDDALRQIAHKHSLRLDR